jgi:hypothetical protein
LGYASARRNGRAANKRSGLEVKVEEILCNAGIKNTYETLKFSYEQPAQKRRYLADYELPDYPNVVIEAKGRFTSADRKKMLLLQAQYPDTQFIMVFGRSINTLSKSSKTTYGDWCDKHGIDWLDIASLKTDPNCLLRLIQKPKNGNSSLKTLKKPKPSTKSAKGRSSRASQ